MLHDARNIKILARRPLSMEVEKYEDFIATGIETVERMDRYGFWGDSVVDIGCGSGRIAVVLARMGLCSSYMGYDVSGTFLATARELLAEWPCFQFEKLDFYNEQYSPAEIKDAGQFSLREADGSQDCVVCMSLFTHLGTIAVAERYLDEIRRVLIPGGRAWLTWFRSPPNEVTEDPFRTVYPEPEIRRMLDERRLEIEREEGGSGTDFHDQWSMMCRKAVRSGDG